MGTTQGQGQLSNRFELHVNPDSALDDVQEVQDGTLGYIHSYEVGSAVDGPGLRFVLFTTGCFLRCQYCHNPDTWHLKNGKKMTVDEMMVEIGKYTRYLKVGRGGLTISGGEPVVQKNFVARIFRRCRELGIHTALDTAGLLGDQVDDEMLADIDLVILDIKSSNPETYLDVTGKELEPTLQFARRLSDMGKPMWVRFVLVPGLTDEPANVRGVAEIAATLKSLERVEILPFHQMGKGKWDALGLEYKLAATEPPSPELIKRVQEEFSSRGIKVY